MIPVLTSDPFKGACLHGNKVGGGSGAEDAARLGVGLHPAGGVDAVTEEAAKDGRRKGPYVGRGGQDKRRNGYIDRESLIGGKDHITHAHIIIIIIIIIRTRDQDQIYF
jgi:hypothetical protein